MQLEEGTSQTKSRQTCRVPCHEDPQEGGAQQDFQTGHKLEQQWCWPGLNLISYKLSCPGFCTSGVSCIDSAEDRTVG